jgi:heat shock transcription factor
MQKRQDAKVQDLHRRLQPLSPSGSIPGLSENDSANPFEVQGSEYDPNAFLNFDNWNENTMGLEGAGSSSNPFDPSNFGTDFNWDGFDDSTATDGMFQAAGSTALPSVDPQGTDEDAKIENPSNGVQIPDTVSGESESVLPQNGSSTSSHKRQKTSG